MDDYRLQVYREINVKELLELQVFQKGHLDNMLIA